MNLSVTFKLVVLTVVVSPPAAKSLATTKSFPIVIVSFESPIVKVPAAVALTFVVSVTSAFFFRYHLI